MQQINKLNGFPFKEFEDIGIKVHNLYRYARSGNSEQEIIKKAFTNKYGPGGKLDSFNNYYVEKITRCSQLRLHQRVDLLAKIKSEYYKAGILFGFNEFLLDCNWEYIVSSYFIDN